MPRFYHLTYLASGEKFEFSESDNLFYVQEDGILLPILITPAWCDLCKKIRNSEIVESLDKLDAHIADLENPNSEICQISRKMYGKRHLHAGEANLKELKSEAQLRRRWLIGRVSPPKCLSCGTTTIIPLQHKETVVTPAGPIYLQVRGLCSGDFPPAYYSTEGDHITGYAPPALPSNPSPRRPWWQFWK